MDLSLYSSPRIAPASDWLKKSLIDKGDRRSWNEWGQAQFSLFCGIIKRERLLPAAAELQQIADTPTDQPLQIVDDRRYNSIRLTAGFQGLVQEERAEIIRRKQRVHTREIIKPRNEQVFDKLMEEVCLSANV